MWPHTQILYVAGLGMKLGYEARLCGPVTIGVADAMSCMI